MGTKLAVTERTEAGFRSGILSLDGSATAWDEALCYFGAISPDGLWRACYREGQVYLRSLSDRGFVRQVSTAGGSEPRWCPAGNQLFFRNGSRFLATSVSFEPSPHWDPPRVVFEADFLDTDGYPYDVSPDGQYLYVAKPAASTTGSDADWIVKLIDVYPERNPESWDLAGYQLMVSSEVFRGRYRSSFEKPEPITPDAVLEYSFSLHTQNHAFRKGHRLMVQVQSTWFPLIDRNPQTFVPNIFEAKESDFRAATHRVYRSSRYPSRVTVPVVVRPPS